MTGLAAVTDELLADAGALENILSQAFAEEIGFKLDDAIINGDGAGKPLGVLACRRSGDGGDRGRAAGRHVAGREPRQDVVAHVCALRA